MLFRQFLLFWGISSLVAQSPSSGYIVSKGIAVPYATILNTTTQTWSISEEDGFFWVPEFSQLRDTLHIERIGYLDSQVILKHQIQTIHLTLNPIEFTPVPVTPTESSSTLATSMGRTRHELLSSLETTILRSYGGNAGIAQAAIDGGRTEDVKIIFDGIDITNPQNGLTDLSQLPNQYLGRATLNKHAISLSGSGSADGIIELNPWQKQSGFQMQWTQGGATSLSGQYSIEDEEKSLSILGGHNQDPGTHPVNYNNQKITLNNNAFNQQFIATRYQSNVNNIFYNLSLWGSTQDRGINNLVWSPSLESSRSDSLYLISISSVILYPTWFIKGVSSFRLSREKYMNPDLNIVSHHSSSVKTHEFIGKTTQLNHIELHGKLGYTEENLSSTDAGNHTRYNWFLSSTQKLKFNPIQAVGSYRLDLYTNLDPIHSYKLTTEFTQWKWLNLSYSMGSFFRIPSFNDKYWEPGGNPDLQQEESVSSTANVRLKWNNNHIGMTYKKSSSTNLIVWKNQGSFWSPENIDQSSREVMGVDGSYSILDFLMVDGSLSFIKNINRKTQQRIRYSPNKIGHIGIHYVLQNWVIKLSYHLTGEQLIMYDYPTDITLADMVSSYLSIQSPYYFENSFQFNLSISNVFDHDIMTVYGYPEPSRQLQLSFSYQFNKSR